MSLYDNFIYCDKPFTEGNVDLFRKKFVCDGEVRKATLRLTALGVYVAKLNGTRIGSQRFAPGYTYYPRDLCYQSYDVTEQLACGENELKVYLAQGWYSGRFTFENITRIYGDTNALSFILEIETDNGNVTINSDESTEVLTSPYDYAGFYDGEVYHSSREGQYVCNAKRYCGKLPQKLSATETEVRLQERLLPVGTSKLGDKTIVDFGQNMAGVIAIDSSKMNSDSVIVRHGEILNPDGTLYTDNLRKAKATIEYHKGEKNELYIPEFTYMGFRYVEISECDYTDGMIFAYAVYTEMPRTGEFTCKNELVQKLYENQVWGQKSNYVEIPTDCPQRDERMGYTGDGQVYATTGCYNFDAERFFDKFLNDIRRSQEDNTEGYVAATVPARGAEGIGFMNMLGWGNAVTRIPSILKRIYGADGYMTEYLPCMEKFVAAELRHMKGNLWIGVNLGDWLTYGKSMGQNAMSNNPVSNAFIAMDLRIIAQAERLAGNADKAEQYEQQLMRTKEAYIRRYVKRDGKMRNAYQGAYIMALAYVVEDKQLRDKMLGHLVTLIKKQGMRTGFFSTEFVLPLLVECGETRLAFDLLLCEECPSWLYQVKAGATTTWERWDALKPDGTVNDKKVTSDNMVSFNHYAFGSVGRFYYEHILGIQPLNDGFNKVRIKPCTDRRLGAVCGSYISRRGKITVKWEYEGEVIKFCISTPVETEIELPDGSKYSAIRGEHRFECAATD